MRIESTRIFSGKLKMFKQMLTRSDFLKKFGACVLKAPVFFLSFLAGKLKNFDNGYHESKSQHNLAKTILILHTAK